MKQSRLGSFIESTTNTAIGFIVSWLTWIYVAGPLFHLRTSHRDSLGIVLLFTVVSIIRSYFTRRAFDWLHHRGSGK